MIDIVIPPSVEDPNPEIIGVSSTGSRRFVHTKRGVYELGEEPRLVPTKEMRYIKKQQARANALAARRGRDVFRGLQARPAEALVLSEERIIQKQMERRWMPDTEETEWLARRMDAGKDYDKARVVNGAMGRATTKAMMKAKIVAERGMKPPGETETPPVIRDARLKNLVVEGTDYLAGPG